jgi:hypothetical protein
VSVSGKRIPRTLLHLWMRLGRTGLAHEYAGDVPSFEHLLLFNEENLS